MTRVFACGAAFADAAEVLGLDLVTERPEVVLVDLDDAGAVTAAAEVAADIPRIVLAGAERDLLLRAAGSRVAFARSADPAALGPLLAALAPARTRSATRLYVVTGTAGGIGRTLLVVDLAVRLAARASVLVLDATGAGAAAWWLGLAPSSWSDLEGLVDELSAEHLAVVASERERIRLIGGPGVMPSARLLAATTRASEGLADLVLIDAPSLIDERTRAVVEIADRVLVLSPDSATAAASLDGAIDGERTWLLASRCRSERMGDHAVLRALPDDPAAVRAAMRGRSPVAGALGRAYDDLAELIALDLG
jgi:Mrp family chromosome partitioning ATPase